MNASMVNKWCRTGYELVSNTFSFSERWLIHEFTNPRFSGVVQLIPKGLSYS